MAHDYKNLFDCRVPSWMEQAGPEGDVVLSSRIRLARNLSGVPFPSQADEEQIRLLQKFYPDLPALSVHPPTRIPEPARQ